jgi:adenosine deaminase
MSASPELIARLPKVELHCHLEGAVPAETFIALSDQHGRAVPTRDVDHVYDFTSFLGFLDLYYGVCDAIRTPADFERAVYDSLAWAKRTGNLRYREMFWSATNHDHCSYADAVAGITAGIEAAERDLGVGCRMITAINRRQPLSRALALVDDMAAHPSPYVIGLGIDDDEDSGPPEMFVEAFQRAKKLGLKVTAHAGELGVAANVSTSLAALGCDRIDHGYAMSTDPAVLQQVLEAGVHVTGAWFVNNFHYGVFTEGKDPATSPLAQMLRAGVPVSLNTDDPCVIPTTLNAEYEAVATALDLSDDQMVAIALAAVDGSWLDDVDKAPLRSAIRDAVTSPS